MTIEPGTNLDRYELLCLLARGGMANVWLARMAGKHGFEKLLAVKTILTQEADNESFTDMFLDEARLASRIDHPSVVRVTDVGEYLGVPYLVMELIEGEAVDKLVRTAEKRGVRVPVGVALRIVADACHGLQAAHELKDADGASLHVVHRDISPQNILVTTTGLAKIIDFGIAKARDRSAGPTTTGTLKGKISYMPKEQALGKEVDARADTWALGAVLYFMLVGRPPYREETQLATLRMAMAGAPIAPLPQTIPALVRSFVTNALSQDLAGRFQTAAEMGDALENLIRRLGTVTTHAETGAFVKTVMADKIAARKRLVDQALLEAAHRERSGVEVTIPAALGIGEGTSVDASGSVRPEESGARLSATAGTFAAPSYHPPRVPRWHSIALVAATLMGALVAVLLVAVLLTHNAPSAAKAAPGEGAASKAAAVGADAKAEAKAEANAKAEAEAKAKAKAKAEAKAEAEANAKAEANARVRAAVVGDDKRVPRPPATGVASTAAAPAAMRPLGQPAPAVTPARTGGPIGGATAPTKKRDDEAGF